MGSVKATVNGEYDSEVCNTNGTHSYFILWLKLTHFREGTWQFMSARFISNLKGQHDIHDDLESLIYVLLWMVLMFWNVLGAST